MAKYVGVLLTHGGYFCISPAWDVKEGDLVGLPDVLSGGAKAREVLSVVIDEEGGQYIEMMEKYIGYPLPRITAIYRKSEVVWNDVPNDQ